MRRTTIIAGSGAGVGVATADWAVSEHGPVWAEFYIDGMDDVGIVDALGSENGFSMGRRINEQ
ncbi:hypothetical protein ACFL6S_00830 [Candidatus Poribacteria bacterium]